MKKLLSLLLATLLFMSMFTACSNEQGNTDKPTPTDAPQATPTDAATPTETPSAVTPMEIVEKLNASSVFATTSGATEAIVNNVSSKDDIVKSFTDEDFTMLDVTNIAGAKFETIMLLKGSHLVTLYWREADKVMKVLWEEVDEKALIPLKANETTDTGTATVAQIGIERANAPGNPLNGMCYVIKAASGKAIIIDGGNNNEPCADNIYNALEKMEIAKDENGKFIIEAWIFSHGHEDHYGAMQAFAPKYSDKVNLEYLIHSFPVNLEICAGANLDVDVAAFDALWQSAFPNAVRIIPHAGIKYYFSNVTIDMLYTPGMIWSPETPLYYSNDASLVMKLQAGGASLLSYGDAGEEASEAMVNSYDTSAFASSVLQITHHGLTTSGFWRDNEHSWDNVKVVYEATDATYAFLPMHEREGNNSSEVRNGRWTVIVEWGYYAKTQMAFVIDETQAPMAQSAFNDFCDMMMEEPFDGFTCVGYDGINKITNEEGMITYLGANNYRPMVTIFEFSNGAPTLTVNEELHSWLG